MYGGGSFLIPYFLFVALIGFTGVSGEMSFGRATRSGPVDAFGFACETKGKRKAGEALGLIPVLGSWQWRSVIRLSWGGFSGT